jgi:hypothetical protein
MQTVYKNTKNTAKNSYTVYAETERGDVAAVVHTDADIHDCEDAVFNTVIKQELIKLGIKDVISFEVI